jgi:3-hydroxyisobutyrate dehydrogenase
MVPTSKHVQEVYTGKNSVLTALQNLDEKSRAQTLCLDESTIEQSVSKTVALRMREIGAEMMDAPVSGGMAVSVRNLPTRLPLTCSLSV